MKKLVDGKIAMVTGGGAGMGACDCWKFAEEGAAGIVIVDLKVEDAEKVASGIMEKYPDCKCVAVKADVSKEADVDHCFEVLEKEFGTLDILVNNAGDFVLSGFLTDSYEEGLVGLERMLRLFAGSTYAFTQLAAPHMADRGGAIINVLTNHVHRDICRVSAQEHAYDAAKYAQLSLNMSMAVELHPRGIRVNAVDPAATLTRMLTDFFAARGMEPTVENISKMTRVGSLMMPEDVALAICNLIEWEDPAPVGKNYLLQFRRDCENLKYPPKEG